MTQPMDATMDEVVERLTIHSAHYPDLRVLLAAYQLVREERDDLREFADKVREIDPIMARMIANGIGPRTGGTE